MEDVKIIFTEREQEILRLLAKYSTNEDMCRELKIGRETLMTHFKNIKRKTNIRAGFKEILIKYAVDNGYGVKATPA